MLQSRHRCQAIAVAVACTCFYIAGAVVFALLFAGPVASLLLRILTLIFIAAAVVGGANTCLPRSSASPDGQYAGNSFPDLFECFTGRRRRTLLFAAIFILVLAIAVELLCMFTLRPLCAGVFGGREMLFIPLLLFCVLGAFLVSLQTLYRNLCATEEAAGLSAVRLSCCALVFCCSLAILMCFDMTPVRYIGWNALIFASETAAACAIILAFACHKHTAQTDMPVIVVQNPESALDKRCEIIAQRFELTKAEQIVLPLLIRGNSRPAMADKLSVSLATINTHVQHIYQKTMTHKRSELTDLVEGTRDER